MLQNAPFGQGNPIDELRGVRKGNAISGTYSFDDAAKEVTSNELPLTNFLAQIEPNNNLKHPLRIASTK